MKSEIKTILGTTALVLVVLFAFFIFLMIPIALIWSLNVLFGFGIEISVETWAASLFLMMIVASRHPFVKS